MDVGVEFDIDGVGEFDFEGICEGFVRDYVVVCYGDEDFGIEF